MKTIEQQKVVIVGAGPSGIEAAKTVQLYSNDITIISRCDIGDWSKLGWSAGIIDLMNHNMKWEDILVNTQRKVEDWSNTIDEDLFERGIKRTKGTAININQNDVIVETSDGDNIFIPYDKLFISVGSSPDFPKGLEPDDEFIFSPQSIKSLHTLPDSLLLIGNGPISYEYVSIFNSFGIKIKWLAPDKGPNTPFDPIVHTHLNRMFESRGIEIINGPFIKEIRKIDNKVIVIREDNEIFIGEKVFLSIGFRSNVHLIKCNGLNLKYQDGNIVVNEFGQTNQPNIYVIGDARNANSSSLSMHQARFSVIHSFEPMRLLDSARNPPIIFNYNPQVGIIGSPDSNDKSYIVKIKPRRFKSTTSHSNEEIVKMTFEGNGEINSAVVIGEFASEMINLIALAINFKITIDKLANFYASHPSYSEVMLTFIREIEYQMESDNLDDQNIKIPE